MKHTFGVLAPLLVVAYAVVAILSAPLGWMIHAPVAELAEHWYWTSRVGSVGQYCFWTSPLAVVGGVAYGVRCRSNKRCLSVSGVTLSGLTASVFGLVAYRLMEDGLELLKGATRSTNPPIGHDLGPLFLAAILLLPLCSAASVAVGVFALCMPVLYKRWHTDPRTS
jgi:hypothetical protein